MKYSVLFGYTGKIPQGEWAKFETDDLDSAVCQTRMVRWSGIIGTKF